MNEQKLQTIDIEAKSIETKEPIWTHIHNSASSGKTGLTTGRLSFTGQGTSFAFNFQIQSEEEMETTENLDTSPSRNKRCTEVGDVYLQHNSSLQDTPGSSQSKKKKKKKGKSKAADGNKQQVPIDLTEDTELSKEEQLQRQLDWCIEQLELGMKSQKATPKHKEEASLALKTLRSTKAPLVKKRQVMRAMAGDYRKKMEEEQSKQFKLIQNETASVLLRAVSEFPKKSVFHRRAAIKPPTSESDSNSNNAQETEAIQPETNFVFTPSKEEFLFNFL